MIDRRGIKMNGMANGAGCAARIFAACLALAVVQYALPSAAGAATKLYFRDSVSPIDPGADDERDLTLTAGTAEVTYTQDTINGPVTPPAAATQFTRTAGGTVVTWYSDPVDAVTISGAVTFNIWAAESATQANATITAALLRADNAGVIQSTIAAVVLDRTELLTTLQAENWFKTPASTALSSGDRLAVRVYMDDGATVTLVKNRSITATLGGGTAGASGDSWVQVTEALAPVPPAITGITNVSTRAITAGWQSVPGAVDYTLGAALSQGSPPTIYADSTTAGLNAIVDTPVLSPNTTYFLYVKANSAGGSSSWAAYPGTSTLLEYDPTFSSFTVTSTNAVQFNWSAGGNPYPATLYRVVVSTADDPLNPGTGQAATAFNTYNVNFSSSGLAANTTYFFRVAGLNNNNVATAYTAPQGTSTWANAPTVPVFNSVNVSSITFGWSLNNNSAGVTLYRVLSATVTDPSSFPAGAVVVTSDTYNLSVSTIGLNANVTYYFQVAAINKNGVVTAYTATESTSTWANAPTVPVFNSVNVSSITFGWSLNNNPAGVTLYRVLSATVTNPSLFPAGAVVVTSDTYNLSVSTSGLNANTTYYFQVAAINKNGVVTAYAATAGTSTLVAFPPASPAIGSVSEGAIVFGWSRNNNPEWVTRYRVLSSTVPDPSSFPAGAVVVTSDTYNLSLNSTGLDGNTTYYFQAAAINNNGVPSGYTGERSTSTKANIPPGSELTGITDSAMQFGWSSTGNGPGTLYRALASTAAVPSAPGAGQVVTTSDTYNVYFSSSGLSAEEDHYFQVAAINNNGIMTEYAAPVTAKTLPAGGLGAPIAGTTTDVYVASITANWSLVSGATGYTLAASLSAEYPPTVFFASATVAGGAVVSTTVYAPALSANTTYYLFVRANGSGKISSWSAYPGTSTLLAYPPIFTGFSNVDAADMQFDWDENGNIYPGTLFRVLSSTAPDPANPGGAVVAASDTYRIALSSVSLSANTTYFFRVAGLNNNNIATAYTSPQGTSTWANAPTVPAFSGVNEGTIGFGWSRNSNPDGTTLYRVLSATMTDPSSFPAGAVVVTSDTYNVTLSTSGLNANTTYYFQVAAINKNGVVTAYTTTASTSTRANAPITPVFNSVNEGTIGSGWSRNNNPVDITLYRVLSATVTNPSLFPAGAVVVASDTYNLSLSTSGLNANTTYYFQVAAVNKNGVVTAYTTTASTSTRANAPITPVFSGVNEGTIGFGWSRNSNPDGTTLYRVLSATVTNPSSFPAGAVVVTSDTYNVTLSTSGLNANTTYYFQVAAVNKNGVVTAYTTTIGTSTLVAFPPALPAIGSVSEGAIVFGWSRNNNPDLITRYRVLSSTVPDPSSFPAGAVVRTSDTYNVSLSSSGLNANTTYYFQAAAVNNNWVLTDYTGLTSTATRANIPLTAVSTFSGVGVTSFTVAWNNNLNPIPGTVYTVQVSTASDFNAGVTSQATASTAPASGPAYTFTNLGFSTTYYFQVRAVNHNGVYTDYVPLGSTRTLSLPAPVVGSMTNVSTNSITAGWQLAAGATGYVLAASTNPYNPPSPIYASSTTSGSLGAGVGDLVLNTTYYFFVRSNGPGESSPWSAYPATSTLANIPVSSAPTFSAVDFNGFVVRWDRNSNPLVTTAYTVQISTAYNFNAGVTDQVSFTTAPEYGPIATFSGLNDGTLYYFRVRANHNNGTSTDWLEPGSAMTMVLPAIHAAGDGVILYGKAGETLPQFRNYSGAGNSFSPVESTISGAVGSLFVIKTNPLTSKQEAVAGYVKDGTLHVLCTDGANWSEEWTSSVGGNETTRRFDIAYESNTGDVMVLYSNNASVNEAGYYTKPGDSACGSGSWSGPYDRELPTTGVVQWVKMVSDPRASSGTIAAIWADSNSDLSAMLWNGTAWGNEPSQVLETSLEVVSAAQDVEDFDVEFESLSGDLMVVWSNSGGDIKTNGVRVATAAYGTSYSWATPYAPAGFANDATNLDLAANPNSNELVFASIGDGGSDMQVGHWSGSSWTVTNDIDATCATPQPGTKLVAVGWVSSGTYNRSIVAYNDASATNIGWYAGNGGTFGAAQTDVTPTPAFADPQKTYAIQQDPVNKDRLMFTISDGAAGSGRLFAKRLIMTSTGGFTWSNADGAAALEATLPSPTVGGYSFVYWPAPPTSLFTQSAYRFFANDPASTDVGAPLAAQNAAGALTTAGTAFRLRADIHISQVDLPVNGQQFKLQFAGRGTGTCEEPSGGTPAGYTDVTAASAVIAFNDNPVLSDGQTLIENVEDPKHGAHANAAQTYEEANNFTNSASGILRNQDGLWDFALKDNGMTAGITYCLRIVKSDDSLLNSYEVYPAISLVPDAVINEVYVSSSQAAGDWVELYNNTSATFTLTGWTLRYVENTIALGGAENLVWTGQAGDVMNARSTFTITPGSIADLNGNAAYHVKLRDNAGNIVDQVQWPGPGILAEGQSFARIADGSLYFEIDPTPTGNYSNSIATDALKINEVAYGALNRQFIELYNTSVTSTITLAGYSLRNSVASANGLRFRIKSARKVYPRNYAVLDFSSVSEDVLSSTDVFGPQGLAAAGDFLALENSTGSTVDAVTWQGAGEPYSRYNDIGEKASFGSPAPANAAYSIGRQFTEGYDTDDDLANFTGSGAATTLGSRNNSPGGAEQATLTYPVNTNAAPQFLARKFPITMTFTENSAAGAANNIIFERTGGTADANSPHIYRLQDMGFDLSVLTQQTTVQTGLAFNDQDGSPLVSSASYRVTFNTETGAGSAPQIILDTVTYDASVHAVTGSTTGTVNMNNAVRESIIKIEISNNSPAGFNGLQVTTVTFKVLDQDLGLTLTTAKAQNIFNAIMLVRDSASGVTGVYESALDISTIAYVPKAAILIDPANGRSTMTVLLPGAETAGVVANSTQTFYLVFESTQNASDRAPDNIFRVRFDPQSDVRLRDGPGGQPQDFLPAAQVDTSSVTLIAPAQPPAGTDWPYTPPVPAAIDSSVGVYNGNLVSSSVYVASSDGVLRTIYSTGTLRWEYSDSASPIVTAPDVQEEGGQIYIYYANEAGDVYRLRDDGSSAFQSWKRNLGNGIRVRSDIMDNLNGKLYFGADNGAGTYRIYCINKTDGNDCTGWNFSGSITSAISGAVSIDDRTGMNTGWIGLEDGNVVSFQTGDATSNKGYVALGFQPTPVMPIRTSPYVDSAWGGANNNLYIASTNGWLYSRTSANLTITPTNWTDFDTGSPIYSSPFVADLAGGKFVFIGSDDHKLYKIDATYGGSMAPAWTYQTGGPIKTMPVVVPAGFVGLGAGEDFVYFGSDDGYIYAVNANNGTLRTPGWPVKTGGPVRADPAIDIPHKTLIIGSEDGKTYTICIGVAPCNP